MTRLRPGCKINLSLRVHERRPDGYHSLDSVFIPLPWPCDDLLIDFSSSPGCSLECDDPALAGSNNILHRAYASFCEHTGHSPAIRCRLYKRIPQGAGLGGGSSDAAALLAWLNDHSPEPLDTAQLMELASRIGSDVPFFLVNRPIRAQGRGEILSPLAAQPPAGFLVLVAPSLKIETSWAYAELDRLRAAQGGAGSPLTKEKSSVTGIFPPGGLVCPASRPSINDLEAPVFKAFPELERLKEQLRSFGPAHCGMSGSGSCMFGIYREQKLAIAIARSLRIEGYRVFTLSLKDQ